MKKTLAILALAAATTMASAYDITGTVDRNFGPNTTTPGFTVGNQFGPVRGEVAVSRIGTSGSYFSYGVNGLYPLVVAGPVTVSAKAGVAYLNTKAGNGYAVRTGLQASYPLTTQVSLIGDVGIQRAESKLRANNGSYVGVGVRYSF